MLPLRSVLARSHLPALDGLRALAVFTVIAYHGGLPIPGDLGVSAFFVLSGFLVTLLMRRELDRTGSVALGGFYRRRTLRIFPAYYAYLLVAIAWDWRAGDHWSLGNLAAALTYTVNYYVAGGQTTVHAAHAWSLGVEEQFYLLWPVLFLLFHRLRWLPWGAIGLVLVSCGWRSLATLQLGFSSVYAYNAFETRLDCLAIGCVLACFIDRPVTERLATQVGRPWMPPLLLGLLLLSRLGGSPVYHYAIGFTVDSLLIAALLLALLTLHAHPAYRWIDARWIAWLGAISYPLYLWHGRGLAIGERILGHAWRLPVGIVVSIGLAAGSYYLLERPLLRFRTARLKHPQAAPDTHASPHFDGIDRGGRELPAGIAAQPVADLRPRELAA